MPKGAGGAKEEGKNAHQRTDHRKEAPGLFLLWTAILLSFGMVAAACGDDDEDAGGDAVAQPDSDSGAAADDGDAAPSPAPPTARRRLR